MPAVALLLDESTKFDDTRLHRDLVLGELPQLSSSAVGPSAGWPDSLQRYSAGLHGK